MARAQRPGLDPLGYGPYEHTLTDLMQEVAIYRLRVRNPGQRGVYGWIHGPIPHLPEIVLRAQQLDRLLFDIQGYVSQDREWDIIGFYDLWADE